MGPKRADACPFDSVWAEDQSAPPVLSASQKRRRRKPALVAVLFLAAILALGLLFRIRRRCEKIFALFSELAPRPGYGGGFEFAAGPGPGAREDAPFSWAEIPPSRSLTWHHCYAATPGLECARLDVPMDWLDPSDEERVILAIVRLRAAASADNTNGASSGRQRPPVFFNPGGPGGSGIWALRDHGRDLQTIVGRDTDIVSFDPRGVGASVPRVECWPRPHAHLRAAWDLQDVGVMDAHPGIVYDAFARAEVLSRACEANQPRSPRGNILEHSATASHARDLLEIVTQLGEQRLRYWGFSYGTVLGGTFAAMFPWRVERMVNDGNVDYGEWYQGNYTNFVGDADKVMDAFYASCHGAGPLRCAFYDSTPMLIRRRLDALLAKLRVAPVPSFASSSRLEITPPPDTALPELVTYSKVRRMLSTALYQPIHRFQRVATVLAALERGDAGPYHAYTALDRPGGTAGLLCPAEAPSQPLQPGPDEDTPDAFAAVMCSDAEPFAATAPEFEEYARLLQNISAAAGAVQASSRLSCAGRTTRPKWRFRFFPSPPSPQLSSSLLDAPTGLSKNTSAVLPILFVNNIADNVTPLSSALRNAALFSSPDADTDSAAAVLVQNSYGHTSLAAPSTCTALWIRRYFRRGEMPPRGTICEGDGGPFGLSGLSGTFSPGGEAGGSSFPARPARDFSELFFPSFLDGDSPSESSLGGALGERRDDGVFGIKGREYAEDENVDEIAGAVARLASDTRWGMLFGATRFA